MTRILRIFIGAILLALIFTSGIVCAADGKEPHTDLNVTKVVNSTGPYDINDEVTWVVTVWNNGPANATNISIAEDISHLPGLKNITAVAGLGTYNTTTNIWKIDELKNASYTTLTLKTTFSTPGNKMNKVAVTALNETDPILNNNHAEATVRFNASGTTLPDSRVSANLVFKPATLNLKSKGVFTVLVSLTGAGLKPADDERKKPSIDYTNSSLTCSGAELVRASTPGKDGRILIAKFHRTDLENATSGNGVKINCSGTLAVNGMLIPVEGSDTIRVIGEKKGLNNVLSKLWKFLGIEKDDVEITEGDDGNITVTLSLDPDNVKNPGQVQKMLKIITDDADTVQGNGTAPAYQNRSGKEKDPKNTKENIFRGKNAYKNSDKGNKESDKSNDLVPAKAKQK